MVDPNDHKVVICPDDCFSSESTINVRTCVDCGTSKTPLWRGGPAGPKSLCNACGIRSRKKRRALLIGVTKEEKKTKKTKKSIKNMDGNRSTSSSSIESCTSSSGDCTGGDLRVSIKKKLWDFGGEALQRPRSKNITKRRKELGEEEQAAILLMALSCGSMYA